MNAALAGAFLATRIKAVLTLHKPMDYGDDVGLCFECHTTSPCPTVRLLNGEELP
jgi:hypothetical protein